jgi:predicted regulator of Ras-like GTPase activity (Roadblock/LC7/MglB family)
LNGGIGAAAVGPYLGLPPVENTDSVSAGWLELQAATKELGGSPLTIVSSQPDVISPDVISHEVISPEVVLGEGRAVLDSAELTAGFGSVVPETTHGDEQQSEQTRRHIDATKIMTELEEFMAINSSAIKELLAKLESGIDGFIGAAIADSESGMCLGASGGAGVLNLEVAAASNTEVVRAKRKAMKTLNLRDEIEDILITLGKQYHLIRPLRSRPSIFIYIALDRSRANLAMARYSLSEIERDVAP